MNKPATRLTIGLFIYLSLLTGGNYSFAQNNSVRLKIAVTTDVHGAFFPNDWYTGKPIPGSLAQVSSWAREQRKVPGQTLILLDNGDLIQGDPASYYSNFISREKPNIAARILNYMGYEAATAGNHDLEAGHPVYDPLMEDFRFPWLAANAVKTGSEDPWFKPYAILEHSGVRIAVLGLITPKIPDWLPPALWSGLEFRDMIESASKWTQHILTTEKPDLLIGLFHSGVDPTYGNQQAGKPLNENASRLVAGQVPGFDIVFTGHDHRNWNLKVADPRGDSVLILGSESRAAEIAVADIRMIRKGDRYEISTLSGSHREMNEYAPDPEFMNHFRGYIDSVQVYVDQPVGTLTHALTTEDAWFGPSAFVDLIHRAQLDLTGAEISFTAPLSFRATLTQGLLKVSDLFRIYRYENQLYTINLTGTEILGYLNFSYSLWMKTMAGPEDMMLNLEQAADGSWRFKNAYYNFDSAAGIDYTVDLTQPAGRMVTILRMAGGQPFDPAKTYRVALNSYRGSGGGGHLSQGAGLDRAEIAGRLADASEADFRQLLTAWIQKQGTLQPFSYNNWKTVPEDWTRLATQRDAGRLFPGR